MSKLNSNIEHTSLQRAKSKRLSVVHLEAQGTLLATKWHIGDVSPPPRGNRGIVTDFSKGSRRRLIRKIARLNAPKAVFLTLTYPQRFPDGKRAKEHLRAMLERLRRRYPKMSAIWRLEYQMRGAPHFHLICFDLPFVPFEEMRVWWASVISEFVDDHAPRIRLEMMRSSRGIMHYVSKYVAKLPEAQPTEENGDGFSIFIPITYLHVGRWWGVFNKEFLPYAPLHYVEIRIETGKGFYDCKRFMRKIWSGMNKSRSRGGVVFSEQSTRAYVHMVLLLMDDLNNERNSNLIIVRS